MSAAGERKRGFLSVGRVLPFARWHQLICVHRCGTRVNILRRRDENSAVRRVSAQCRRSGDECENATRTKRRSSVAFYCSFGASARGRGAKMGKSGVQGMEGGRSPRRAGDPLGCQADSSAYYTYTLYHTRARTNDSAVASPVNIWPTAAASRWTRRKCRDRPVTRSYSAPSNAFDPFRRLCRSIVVACQRRMHAWRPHPFVSYLSTGCSSETGSLHYVARLTAERCTGTDRTTALA